MTWTIENAEDTAGNAPVENRLRELKKNHPEAAMCLLRNMERYRSVLDLGAKIENITFGWLHPEREGVMAFGTPKHSKRMKACRLYFYPDAGERKIVLLTAGTKESQSRDVNESVTLMKRYRRKGKGNG